MKFLYDEKKNIFPHREGMSPIKIHIELGRHYKQLFHL